MKTLKKRIDRLSQENHAPAVIAVLRSDCVSLNFNGKTIELPNERALTEWASSQSVHVNKIHVV